MSLNRVILLGRLGRDPEVRYAQSGTTVATLNLATDERRPDGSGGWKNETEWHRVVLFGKQADLAKQYLTKGREVLIEGPEGDPVQGDGDIIARLPVRIDLDPTALSLVVPG